MPATIDLPVDYESIGINTVLVRNRPVNLAIILRSWALLNDEAPTSLSDALRYVLDPNSEPTRSIRDWFTVIEGLHQPTWDYLTDYYVPVDSTPPPWFTQTDLNLAIATIVCGQAAAARKLVDAYYGAAHDLGAVPCRALDRIVRTEMPHRHTFDAPLYHRFETDQAEA